MTPKIAPKPAALAVGLVVAFGLVAGSLYVGRAISGGESTSAQTPRGTPTPVPQGEELPAIPDTSQPGWFHAYQLKEDAKPRYNQEIAGIMVGPDIDRRLCPEPVLADEITKAETSGTPVEVEPDYLPEGAQEDKGGADFGACEGEPALATRRYQVAPDEEQMRRVAAGELTFFEAQHGSGITVHRRLSVLPRFMLNLPSERMRAGEVNGLPAVLVEPMFIEGYGHSAVIVWDEGTSVLTAVQATDLTLEETIRIAQGVLER